MAPGAHLLLYDGVCGLCNGLNRFVIARDRADRFRFAPLQSALARDLLRRLGKDPDDLTTLYAVADYGSDSPRLLDRAGAALFVLRELGWPWRAAGALRVLPRRLLDWGYDVVARNRYRWFGRHERCLVPDAAVRAKFLAVE